MITGGITSGLIITTGGVTVGGDTTGGAMITCGMKIGGLTTVGTTTAGVILGVRAGSCTNEVTLVGHITNC